MVCQKDSQMVHRMEMRLGMNWGYWKGCHLVRSSDCLKEKNSGMSSDFQKVRHLEQNLDYLTEKS